MAAKHREGPGQAGPQKNQMAELEITSVAQDGNGVGRVDGFVVFVPMAAPGDRLRVKIVKVLRSHAYAIIDEILEPGPDRAENTCPVYRRCGGCALRHLEYGAELRCKAAWVEENLARIGHVHPAFDPPLPAPSDARYRNKAQYPVRRVGGAVRTGFFAARSHDLIPVWDCALQPEAFAGIARAFCAFLEETGIEPYDEAGHTGLVRWLYLRRAEATGQIMACVVVNGGAIPEEAALVERLRAQCPDIATVVLNINRDRGNVILGRKERVLYGPGHIEDVLCGVKVRLSPQSFYQVNRLAAEALYRKALEYADPGPGDTLLDLYCGAGTIGLSMAHRAGRVAGVESVPSAVEDARRNARANGLANASFFCGDASGAARLLADQGLTPTIAVLDPPRKGVAPEALDAVCAMKPRRIVYISCNSATLARDLARLAERGYRTLRACAADLFPRTAHVEAVALLERE